MPIEKPPLPLPRASQVLADLGGSHVANAIVAFLFASSGPVAIILAVGARGGLSEADLASWIFGAFFLNGLLGIAFSLAYRQPLVFFWTIPGTVLVGPALQHLSFPEVIGAFHATGALMLLLGLSGWVRRAMQAVPMPIVMAMVAGVFLRFGVDLVLAFREALWIAAPMTVAFFALSAIRTSVPPLIGALVAGALSVLLVGDFQAPEALFALAAPSLYAPAFSWAAMVELVVPLAITVLAVQNAQGIAILEASGHRAPINAIAAACGGASLVTALVGTVSTCLTGPVSAILSAAGEKERQYSAAVLVGVLALGFGLLAPFFTRLLLATPPAFIATLAGLAMLRVLQTAFQGAFGSQASFGALVCFLVTVADVPIFRIGAPFWGLVLGLGASWLLERNDLRKGSS